MSSLNPMPKGSDVLKALGFEVEISTGLRESTDPIRLFILDEQPEMLDVLEHRYHVWTLTDELVERAMEKFPPTETKRGESKSSAVNYVKNSAVNAIYATLYGDDDANDSDLKKARLRGIRNTVTAAVTSDGWKVVSAIA